MWSLLINSNVESNIATVTSEYKAYGSLVSAILEACGTLFRSLMSSLSNDPAAKDDSQSLLEAVYRTQLIKGFIEALRYDVFSLWKSMVNS